MSQEDSGDKTEKPTPKKLQDARKKGDISKSKDVTSTAGMLVILGLAALALRFCAGAARFVPRRPRRSVPNRSECSRR